MLLKQPSPEWELFPHCLHHLGLRGLRKLHLLVHREPLISYAILGVFELTEPVCPAPQGQAQGSQAWSLSPVLALKRPGELGLWSSGALCRGCWGRECTCADSGQRKRDAEELFLSQEAG